MRIDVSEIIKTEGASLNIKFEGSLEDLNSVDVGFKFDYLIYFDGQIENVTGILKLIGKLKVGYSTLCFRCLKEVPGCLDVMVNENFVTVDKADSIEAYTFESKFIEIDKVLVDNIILNIPMKQVCSQECKGLCQRCGSNLNEKSCDCKDDNINSDMEALKNYFKN